MIRAGVYMVRFSAVAVLGCALLLSACGKSDLAEPPVPLGDFALGLNIVVADKAQKVPISRNATVEEWEEVMSKAVEDRFGRYNGTRLYNIGIAVEGYALAPPGIPVVAAPKSILVITANVWDDAKQMKLNPKGEQFHVFESLSGDTVIGTGLTRSKRQQMEALSYNAVKKVEQWFLTHPEWFNMAPDGSAMPVWDDSPSVAPATATMRPPRRPATLMPAAAILPTVSALAAAPAPLPAQVLPQPQPAKPSLP
jgi:hypothetical protein